MPVRVWTIPGHWTSDWHYPRLKVIMSTLWMILEGIRSITLICRCNTNSCEFLKAPSI